jgi:NADH-quinone oxidoreductase subunit H
LHVVLLAKVVLFLWIFIWVRWTLPRFRYDQLMDLGWRKMLPWALANTILTAIVVLLMRYPWGA